MPDQSVGVWSSQGYVATTILSEILMLSVT
jgi:hypothetical protein